MYQWWDGLGQLYQMLQDADALGLSREARRRLIVALGALDGALLQCATVDCPLRSAAQEETSGREAQASPAAAEARAEGDAIVETCHNCRWWARGERQTVRVEGMCMLTRTESAAGSAAQPLAVNTLARAAATDPHIGAVLVTELGYACSQWAPV